MAKRMTKKNVYLQCICAWFALSACSELSSLTSSWRHSVPGLQTNQKPPNAMVQKVPKTPANAIWAATPHNSKTQMDVVKGPKAQRPITGIQLSPLVCWLHFSVPSWGSNRSNKVRATNVKKTPQLAVLTNIHLYSFRFWDWPMQLPHRNAHNYFFAEPTHRQQFCPLYCSLSDLGTPLIPYWSRAGVKLLFWKQTRPFKRKQQLPPNLEV